MGKIIDHVFAVKEKSGKRRYRISDILVLRMRMENKTSEQ